MSSTQHQTQPHYEESYHVQRHTEHINDEYYKARAQIALTKFFKGIDQNSRILDYSCGMGAKHFPLIQFNKL